MQSQAQGELFGSYRLLRRLAFGGMAEIFLASLQRDSGFEKRVVVKRILPQFGSDPAFVKMFIDEAVVAGRLNHPNVIQIYDFGSVDEVYFIAMEYIDGADLRTLLRRGIEARRPLAPAEVAAIGEAVARGLDYAHRFADDRIGPLNIVHRDISPHNILISRSGDVKVTDFGIAKAAARATRTATGTIKGKVAYMAPEQAAGKSVDHRCDQFALGLVLWECLTGERHFDGSSDIETLQRVIACERRPIRDFRTDVPPELDAIVMRMLSPAPDDRFRDMQELDQALATFRFSLGPSGAVHLGPVVCNLIPKLSDSGRRTASAPRQEGAAPRPANRGAQDAPPPSRRTQALPEDGEAPGNEDAAAPEAATAITRIEGAGDRGGEQPEQAEDLAHAEEAAAADEATAAVSEPARSPLVWVSFSLAAAAIVVAVIAVVALRSHDSVVPETVSLSPVAVSATLPPAAVNGGISGATTSAAGTAGTTSAGAAAAAMAPAVIELASAPSGARVFVNGMDVGLSTPASVPASVLAGDVTVELRKDGFNPYLFRLAATDPRQPRLYGDLTPVAAPSPAATLPPVAALPPPPQAPAPASAAAPAPSASPASTPAAPRPSARPAPAGERPARGETGYLSLRSSSMWLDVYLGKKKLGTTPLQRVEVPAGSLVLRLVNAAEGFDRTMTFDIKPGEEARHTVSP